MGGPLTGGTATRLVGAYRRRPPVELIDAMTRALILLADHELATSTLAVRVACSVRTGPFGAIAAGLHTVSGELHGAASLATAKLFEDVGERGAAAVIEAHRVAGRKVPGFGHSVYRNGDPRFAPLIEVVERVPATDERRSAVHSLLAEAGRSISVLPNVDLALGALLHVGELPLDSPIFAIARIAGWSAHYDEEIGERALRYRGLARPR